MSSTEYSLRYIDKSDIPLMGPEGGVTPEEKVRLGSFAESRLEGDINDGSEIPQNQIENVHKQAISAYATYLMSVEPSHPTSTRAGNMPDGSRKRSAFAEELLSIYRKAVGSINEAGGDTGSKDHTIVTA